MNERPISSIVGDFWTKREWREHNERQRKKIFVVRLRFWHSSSNLRDFPGEKNVDSSNFLFAPFFSWYFYDSSSSRLSDWVGHVSDWETYMKDTPPETVELPLVSLICYSSRNFCTSSGSSLAAGDDGNRQRKGTKYKKRRRRRSKEADNEPTNVSR